MGLDRLSKKRKKLKAEQENQTRLVYLDIVCLLRFGTVDQTANKIFNTSIEPSISFVIPVSFVVFITSQAYENRTRIIEFWLRNETELI